MEDNLTQYGRWLNPKLKLTSTKIEDDLIQKEDDQKKKFKKIKKRKKKKKKKKKKIKK